MAGTDHSADSLLIRYGEQSARPLVSLVFVTPLLLIYEGGVLLLGPQSMRNGADVWLRQFLELVGFGQYFLLPALTCGLLLAWHHLRRDPWKFSWPVLSGMFVESILYAVLLLALAQLQGRLMASSWTMAMARTPGAFEQFVGFFGAGIYEELLFRLMLLPALAGVLRWARVPMITSVLVAVLVTSLLFSLAHYRLVSSYGDPFEWYSFTFRLLAGIFFAVVFVLRGFGIVAGTHTFYDILVGFL